MGSRARLAVAPGMPAPHSSFTEADVSPRGPSLEPRRRRGVDGRGQLVAVPVAEARRRRLRWFPSTPNDACGRHTVRRTLGGVPRGARGRPPVRPIRGLGPALMSNPGGTPLSRMTAASRTVRRPARRCPRSGVFVPASISRFSRTVTPTSHDARAIRRPLRSRSRLSIVANIATGSPCASGFRPRLGDQAQAAFPPPGPCRFYPWLSSSSRVQLPLRSGLRTPALNP